jgi:hypothetical protein
MFSRHLVIICHQIARKEVSHWPRCRRKVVFWLLLVNELARSGPIDEVGRLYRLVGRTSERREPDGQRPTWPTFDLVREFGGRERQHLPSYSLVCRVGVRP